MVILLDPRSLLPLQVDVQAAFAKSGPPYMRVPVKGYRGYMGLLRGYI